MHQTKSRGFFTIAQNNTDVDYVKLAYGLALSLKYTQISIKNLSIGITPGTVVDDKYKWAFDNIIEIPWGDHAQNSSWKLENEWKAIWMSPYEETIKLDSDMLFFNDIANWWDKLSQSSHDVIWTTAILDWKGTVSTSTVYRETFVKNNLPNIYTAMGYFRKTPNAFEVYELAKHIYWNWETFFEKYLHCDYRPTYPSTDVIFALAMKLLDIDQYSYQTEIIPTFTHMKSGLQGWTGDNLSEDWREYLGVFFNDQAVCRLGHHRQYYPLHYHIKDFLTNDMIATYERLLNYE